MKTTSNTDFKGKNNFSLSVYDVKCNIFVMRPKNAVFITILPKIICDVRILTIRTQNVRLFFPPDFPQKFP